MKVCTVNAVQYHICSLPGGKKLPNAASRRYQLEKIVDGLLAAAISLSVVLITIVLVTI